jgi:hypothetical protein
MPNIPAHWRKWLYGVSVATIPILVIVGWVSDSLAAALVGLANAVFIGGLAFSNTQTTGITFEPFDIWDDEDDL